MQTRREYLFSIGLTKAPTGRGKFSNDALGAIEKAKREGMEFSDGTPAIAVPRVKVDRPAPSAPAVRTPRAPRKVTAAQATDVIEPAEPRAGRAGRSFVTASGVQKSDSDACGKCQYSILYCYCRVPYALMPNDELHPLVMQDVRVDKARKSR